MIGAHTRWHPHHCCRQEWHNNQKAWRSLIFSHKHATCLRADRSFTLNYNVSQHFIYKYRSWKSCLQKLKSLLPINLSMHLTLTKFIHLLSIFIYILIYFATHLLAFFLSMSFCGEASEQVCPRASQTLQLYEGRHFVILTLIRAPSTVHGEDSNHNEEKYINNLKLLYRTHHKGLFMYISKVKECYLITEDRYVGVSILYFSWYALHKMGLCSKGKKLKFSVLKIYKFLPEIS